VRLDGCRIDAQLVECVPPVPGTRHDGAVEEGPDRRHGFPEPVESLPETRSEVDAEGSMFQLEPRAADPEGRPAAADVVDGRHGLRDEARVAERVRADEESEPDPVRGLGERRQCGVSLEDRLVRVTEDRVEVIPGP